MANAKKAAANKSVFSPILDRVKENIFGTIGKMIRDKIAQIEKMIFEIALSFVFLSVAIFFFLAALVFFLKEYAGMTYALSFFCVGIIALAIAFIVYEIARKK